MPSIQEKRSVEQNALESGDTSNISNSTNLNVSHGKTANGVTNDPLILSDGERKINNTEQPLLNVGDSVTIGNWEGQDLSWTVCNFEDDYAMLICDYCLDLIQYSATGYYYEQIGVNENDKSKIRAWLSDFYYGNDNKGIQSAFTDEDKQIIATSKWISKRNNDLHDFVYIPNYKHIRDKANKDGFKILDTLKDKFFDTPATQRGDGEEDALLYAWTLNESQDDDKIIIEPVGQIEYPEGFSTSDLSDKYGKTADKTKYNAVIPTMWVKRSAKNT